jgi:hypothetical protein
LMGFQRLGQATYLNIGVYLLNTSLLYQKLMEEQLTWDCFVFSGIQFF